MKEFICGVGTGIASVALVLLFSGKLAPASAPSTDDYESRIQTLERKVLEDENRSIALGQACIEALGSTGSSK